MRVHYEGFVNSGRVLLTGHSHQGWPDVAREGVIAAWEDAAAHVDDKWGAAFAQADALRQGVADRIGGAANDVALGANSHELVTRFLSALDLKKRPRLVTTSGEFHSMDRQLRRLAEERVEVVFVDALPVSTLAERLAAAVDEKTAAVLASTVLFETSTRVPHLAAVTAAAYRAGAQVLFDGYHAFNVVPEALADFGPEPFFYVAGGYKYAQWGEGCCFLRVPPGTELRPVFTGWFSDFEHLEGPRSATIGYGSRGADRFAGATYDPTSHYRGARVCRFFDEHGLDVARLRHLSLRQTGRILRGLDRYDVLTPREDAGRGGFVSLRVARAGAVVSALRDDGIYCDARGDVLRFGPAPYVTDDEIDRALDAFRRNAPPAL
ncbi:MAG: kynureninase [Deltaproteobacteria bacterium]|nr:kynureninase [Deltaproteobacteria bacterium]